MTRFLPFLNRAPTVAVIRLQGAIATAGRGLSDHGLAPLIERAFSRGKPVAVALEINSPGGSPVQSSLIAARIRRLSEEKGVPVHAFVEDVAASGGYWLATAADRIWVDRGSIVGSLGVISAGFGFHDLIGRYGIERRVHTAGRSKSQLDPFLPERPEDLARLERMLGELHGYFTQQVQRRRGDWLVEDPELFSGEFWLGEQGVALGLADGIGHLVPKMRELFGDKVRFRRYGQRRGLLSRLGVTAVDQAVNQAVGSVEERALFARYGL